MFTFSDSIMSYLSETEVRRQSCHSYENNFKYNKQIFCDFLQSQIVFGASGHTYESVRMEEKEVRRKGETLEYTSSCLVTLRICI